MGITERDSLTVRALACHAAGLGSNLGEDNFSYFVLFSGYGAVGWETFAGRLSGLISGVRKVISQGHKSLFASRSLYIKGEMSARALGCENMDV